MIKTKALLIYNNNDAVKNNKLIEHIMHISNELNIEVDVAYHDEIIQSPIFLLNNKNYVFAINRSRNPVITQLLETHGILSFNNFTTIAITNSKKCTFDFLNKHSLKTIPTIHNESDANNNYSYPLIGKDNYGHGGTSVKKIHNHEELKIIIPYENFIVQPYIEHISDTRVYMMGDSVLTSIERMVVEGDFRANVSLGAKPRVVVPPQTVLEDAIKVAKLLNSDFIGVDFLLTDDGYIINEIEDVVGMRSVYKLTDIDPFKEYLIYILKCLDRS